MEELSENLQFNLTAGPYSAVTFHPVTLEDNTAERQLHELIAAMDAFPAMSYIVTLANADAGGRAINAIWQAEGASRKNWLVVPSLGCGAISPPSRARKWRWVIPQAAS